MSAPAAKERQADDPIWWRPKGLHRGAPGKPQPPYHSCPTAVVSSLTTRECLDYMALGVCRYCKEPLP